MKIIPHNTHIGEGRGMSRLFIFIIKSYTAPLMPGVKPNINMIRHKLLMILVGCIFLGGCTASHEKEAANFSDSLIVVSGAKKVHYSKVYGGDQLYFQIKTEYPAKAVLDEISRRLAMKGWKPLSESYLNPGLPSSHVKGWEDFIDGTRSPEEKVHQWLAEWENKNGDILFLTLRYSYPKRGMANLKDLTVYQAFAPVKLAIEGRKKGLENTSQNKEN